MSISGRIRANAGISGSVVSAGDVSGGTSPAVSIYVQELVFTTYADFPAVGEANKLYIDTSGEETYRYDETTSTYKCVGNDYNNVNTIQSIIG
jgi:hypothetical protein